jgi:2-dehydropantoate 2-reductase
MQFVVYGAGAVGSVLGGMLSVHKHDVLLVGRAGQVDAIAQDGLRLKSATGEYLAHPRAATALKRADVAEGTIVLLTVKCHDVPEAAEVLEKVVPADTPIVCFQNGVASEAVFARRFSRVYGGVFRMTCSMVQPGNASFRALGRVVVGVYPKGSDAFTRELAFAFRGAGFEAASSRAIESDKWLKLAVNSQSVVHAAVDLRDHDANEFHELKARILDEARRVFRTAKIRARSCDGRDPSLDEMIADLRKPRARRSEHGVKVHNSLWQDLYLKRTRIEAEFIHKPIVDLGRAHGVPTPFNAAMLDIAHRLLEAGQGPESLRLASLLEAVERHRSASAEPEPKPRGKSTGSSR